MMISYIMPVYNVEAHLLEEAVSSVLRVSPDVEVVIVDDGSTSIPTLAVVESLAGRDRRLKVLRQSNGGVAAARNRGIREASHEWISFIDPDDRCPPATSDVLPVLAATAHNLVITAATGISVSGSELERYDLGHLVGSPSGAEILEEMMSLYIHGRPSAAFVLGVPWAKFVRRSFLINQKIFFTEGMVKRSDADWLIRLYSSIDTAAVLDIGTVDYRIDVPGNISRRFRPEILASFAGLASTASAAPVSVEARELYSVELLKDAINSVFSSPVAPRSQVGRAQYREFRDQFALEQTLLADGALRATSLPRKMLYVVIKNKWFLPILVLRQWKRCRAYEWPRSSKQRSRSGSPSPDIRGPAARA